MFSALISYDFPLLEYFLYLAPASRPPTSPRNSEGVANRGGYWRWSKWFVHITDHRNESLYQFCHCSNLSHLMMLTLENRIIEMLTFHANPLAIQGRSTSPWKMGVNVSFGTGPFRELEERINDVVHEQLMSTIYEQSMTPIDDTIAKDLIVSCCTRSEQLSCWLGECQMNRFHERGKWQLCHVRRLAFCLGVAQMSNRGRLFRFRWCAHYDYYALWMQKFQDGGEGREILQVCFSIDM